MADVIYNSFKKHVASGEIDLASGTIYCLLTTSSYSPDQDSHETLSDITNEVTGTGYSSGGQAVTTKTVTQDNSGNQAVFDADDVVWTSSTITARRAVLYKHTGTAGTSLLIACFDFGGDKVSTGGTFTITWNASGILVLA